MAGVSNDAASGGVRENPRVGGPSPWGPIQIARKLADGIWGVGTASHSGIWLDDARVVELHERLDLVDGYQPFTRDAHWWGERDCDWCVPALAFVGDIDDARIAEGAEWTLAGLARFSGGKHKRAWEALRQ